MKTYNVINYVGIMAFLSLVVTVITGVAGADVEFHETMAITTLVLACVHGSLIVWRQIQNRRRRR
jgi:hypothetical protein